MQLDRLVEVIDGAIVVVLLVVCGAAVVERERIAGLELDRLVEVRDGTNQIALAAIGVTAVVEGDRSFESSLIARSKSAMARSMSPLAP